MTLVIGAHVIVTWGLDDYDAIVLRVMLRSDGNRLVVEIDLNDHPAESCPHPDAHAEQVVQTEVPESEIRGEKRPMGWWLKKGQGSSPSISWHSARFAVDGNDE